MAAFRDNIKLGCAATSIERTCLALSYMTAMARPARMVASSWQPARAHHEGVAARLLCLPMVTFKFMAAIHREALRLWLKGAPLVPRQDAACKTGLASRTGNDYTSPVLSTGAKD
jgi:DUF1365 family protein